jgi:uncharacterized protein YqjF (DUF2071 family)
MLWRTTCARSRNGHRARCQELQPLTKPKKWQWSQHWRHLFFAHWLVLPEILQRHLPAGLELDTFEGAAWITIVAFHLEKVRLRGLPPIYPFSNFLELNFRTYVRFAGRPAIYFLSIHAGNRLAVSMVAGSRRYLMHSPE